MPPAVSGINSPMISSICARAWSRVGAMLYRITNRSRHLRSAGASSRCMSTGVATESADQVLGRPPSRLMEEGWRDLRVRSERSLASRARIDTARSAAREASVVGSRGAAVSARGGGSAGVGSTAMPPGHRRAGGESLSGDTVPSSGGAPQPHISSDASSAGAAREEDPPPPWVLLSRGDVAPDEPAASVTLHALNAASRRASSPGSSPRPGERET
mmetsp:Transcript_13187/g.43925  ORF Transcript_13187/g.43925 Transcript_13187/m.43925 type:complete len:216 (+) Transcript_13187:148-795(+)